MSDEKKNLSLEQSSDNLKVEKKSKNKLVKKPNFFVRVWKKICKFFKDVAGEMKKVVWTPKNELKKSTKLVLATVVLVALAIALVDTSFSWIINSIAGLIG